MIDLNTFQAGSYQQGFNYQYFLPTTINQQWQWQDNHINMLLEKASVKLGELNSFSRFVPNIDLFIQLHTTKESVLSNKIEGTHTKIDEALLPELEIATDRKDDWQEVQNYTKALNHAIKNLENLPISSRLIKETHRILLQSVRGAGKLPGKFRKSQNWIGGASLSDAVFIPPQDHHLAELMSDLEYFLNNDTLEIPSLIRIAIAHYQFETIHPFLDGNGRIGRLMIPLYLISKKILDKPLLYLSTYFEKNKTLYYDNLTRVREKNDMVQWIRYFLVGIEQTATEAIQTLVKVIEFKKNMEKIIIQDFGRRARSGQTLLEHLFKNPLVTVQQVKEICNLSYKATNDLLTLMQEKQIVSEITQQSRNRIFAMSTYINLYSN